MNPRASVELLSSTTLTEVTGGGRVEAAAAVGTVVAFFALGAAALIALKPADPPGSQQSPSRKK
jgi:hypothetical protein